MSWDQWANPDPTPAQEPTWGDYAKAAGQTTAGIGAGMAGLARAGLGGLGATNLADAFKEGEAASRQIGDYIGGSMSEEGKARLGASITSEKFWEHPISSTMLKATGMSPYVAAAALPGGLLGEATGAMAATAAAGGVLNAGGVVDDIYKRIDDLSDDELRKQSSLYNGYRADMDEKDAREQFGRDMLGLKPAVAFALGAGTALYGPAGNIVRGLQEGGKEAALKAAGETAVSKAVGAGGKHGIQQAAIEGGLTGAAQEAYSAQAEQQAEKQGGARQQYDLSEIASRALTAGALGGLLGGVTGIGGGKARGEEAEAGAGAGGEESAVQAKTAATQQPPSTAVGVPAAVEPAKVSKAKSGTEVVQPGAADAAQTAALTEATATAPKAEPPEPTPPKPTEQNVPPPVAEQPAVAPPQREAVPPVEQTAAAPTPTEATAPPAAPTDVSARRAVTPEVTPPTEQAAPVAKPDVYQQAVNIVRTDGKASTSYVQRKLGLDYNTAATIMERMEQEGVVGPPNHAGKREILGQQAEQPSPPPPLAPEKEAVAPPAQPAATPPETAGTRGAAHEPAAPKPPTAKGTGRVLQAVTPEANLRAKEQLAAQQASEKAAKKPGAAEKEPGSKKLTPAEKASQAERARIAEEVFGATHEPMEMPETPVARRALALKIQNVLDAAAAKGLVLRENLPENVRKYFSPGKGKKVEGQITPEERDAYHMSIPEKVGGKDMSPHVRYLRELVGVQKALMGQKFGPKSKERARVAEFIIEHNAKDLESLTARRKEAGDEAKRAFQGDVESAEGKVAKGKVTTTESTGAASEGRVLGANEKAVAAQEILQRIKEKAAKEATPTPAPAAKAAVEAPASTTSVPPEGKGKAKALSIKEKADRAAARAEAQAAAKTKEPTPTVARLIKKSLGTEQRSEPKLPEEVTPVTPVAKATQAPEPKAPEQVATAPESTGIKSAEKAEKAAPAAVDKSKEVAPPEKPPEPKSETKPEPKEEVTPEVTPSEEEEPEVKGPSTGALRRKTLEEQRAEKADEEALAARAKAAAERAGSKTVSAEEKAKLDAMAAKRAARQKARPRFADMSDDELAQWEELTRAPTTEEKEAHGAELEKRQEQQRRDTSNLYPGENQIWDTPLHKARDVYGHEDSSLSEGHSVHDVLKALDLEHLTGLPRRMGDFVRRQLMDILPKDLKLYIAHEKLIDDSLPLQDKGRRPAGYYYEPNGGKPYIAIDSDMLKSRAKFAHVVIHEALHAAMQDRIEANPHFKARLQALRDFMEYQFKDTPEWKTARYSATNPHEFVSEVLSKPELQELMSRTEVPPILAKQLKLKEMHPMSLWGAFVSKVREVLGLPAGSHNFLDLSLRTIGPEMERARMASTAKKIAEQTRAIRERVSPLSKEDVTDYARDRAVDARSGLAKLKDKLSSAWQIARRENELYGPSRPLNRLVELRSEQEFEKGKILKEHGGLTAADEIARMEREHPEAMAKAKDVLYDASLHDVNLTGNNDHLGKDKLMGIQAKNEVARLKNAWADKAIDPVRATLERAVDFFRDIHNATAKETIGNILKEARIHDPDLVDRIHNGTLDDTDKAVLGNKTVDALNQVSGLKRKQGSFVPFRRYGDYSVTAEHELVTPQGNHVTRLKDSDGNETNTIQFVDPNPKNGQYGNARARAAVKNYLRQQAHTPEGNKLTPLQIRKTWVDKNDRTKVVEAQDPNAIPAYRVSMQTQHTEFHEKLSGAENAKAALTEAGLVNARTHTREEAYKFDRNVQGAMGTILRSLEKQQRYIDADATQKSAMRDLFHDLMLGTSGNTSIKNSMRQRKNVAGMSRDLGRVTGDYARMTANHLAKLRFRPEIDDVFKEMRDYNKSRTGEKDNVRREQVYNEFVNRIYGREAAAAEEHKPGAVTRLLQVSRLARLAGPSFHIINAHEPWTTSLPVIGGRHGFARTVAALTDAYNVIGGRAGIMRGLADTAKAYTSNTGFTDFPKLFKEAINKNKFIGADKASRMQDVLGYMEKRNLFGDASIFEVGRYANPEGNVLGRALDRADVMANQVGSAIEAINRAVTGLTAYNLEYKRNGGNHEAAMHYAYTTAHETMGDYSSWNAAPVFNTPLGRMALQFKKFGQKTYYLLGNIMGGAIKGDPEAMKQFAGLMVTHGMVAGVLGLPTEPFKVALMAANAVGVTGFTPDDYDYAVRQLAARVAGQKGGEIISRGLYRGIGIEASGRLGLDQLITHGQPKSNKDADIKSWLFDTMAGAPAGYLLDQVAAARAAFKGDMATAIEKAVPIRAAGDIAKAVSGAMGPKKTEAGTTAQEQFSPYETGIRALGFQPSSAAELGAMRGQVARQSMREGAERTSVIRAWVNASGAQKVQAQRAVQAYNKGRPIDEQISQRDLTNAARKQDREEAAGRHGIQVNKRTKGVYEQAERTFNP